MEKLETVVFKLKKPKMLLICFIFSVVLLILSLVMYIALQDIGNTRRPRHVHTRGTYVLVILCPFLIVVSGIQMLNLFLRLIFDWRVGLKLDKRGITDNSGLLSVGFIPWSDIKKFQFSDRTLFKGFQTSFYIVIELHNPAKYDIRGSLLSCFSRNVLCKGVIAINATLLTWEHDKLIRLCRKYLEAYGKTIKGSVS